MSKRERVEKHGDQPKKFKNVFVKNFMDVLDEEQLFEIFQSFGNITSHIIMKDEMGKSKGFGFVAFETHEGAERVSCFLIFSE